jgi:hypothetical protein
MKPEERMRRLLIGTRRAAILAAGLITGAGLTGCGTLHSSRNAPGNIEVEKPPQVIELRKVEPPEDPGENLLIWNVGPFGGLGLVTGTDSALSTSVGGETSVHLGRRDTTHPHDSYIIPFEFPLPDFSVGLNLGVGIGNDRRPANRAGYAEIQLSHELLYAIAGGWAWDPERKISGPQITASVGPLYARTTTMLDRATSLEIGLIFKLPVLAFAWSQ